MGSMKKLFFVRWIVFLFHALSVVPHYLDSRIGSASRKSGKVSSLGGSLQMLYQATFVEPARWLMQMIGVSFRWVRTRQWLGISLAMVPSLVLIASIFSVWYGGRLNTRGALANWYHELGEAEIEQWETSLAAGGGLQNALLSQGETKVALQDSQDDSSKISPFAELLYRRIQLLEPNQNSQIIIAATMMQRGAISSGQNILRRLAPENDENNPKAHAMMAMSYLIEFMKSQNSALLPAFQHHAQASLKWPGTPKDVLIMSGDLYWQSNDVPKALEMYQRAAAVAPEVNVVLFHRALAAGDPRLAELARERGVNHFQIVLNRNPGKVDAITQLAMLMANSDAGAQQAEELLTKAQALQPNPAYARALSEVYRMRFLNVARSSQNIAAGFIYLDKAMVLDPSNPQVAEFMEMMVRQGAKAGGELQSALNEMLVTGRATTGTHAMLAEFHLLQNDHPKALVHLEQVYQVAPSAVKYANNLADCYANLGQWDKALSTAGQTKELLEKNGRMSEKYSDDLLETIGTIYEKQQRFPEAVEAYLECLKLNPNRAETRRLLARVYQSSGDETNASLQEQLASQIDAKVQELTAFQKASIAKVSTERNMVQPSGVKQATSDKSQEIPEPKAADEATIAPTGQP